MKQVTLCLGLVPMFVLTAQVSLAQLPVTDTFDRVTEQVDTIQIDGLKRSPHCVVKLNPLAILDVESLYRVDVERMLSGRFSMQGGLGYGNRSIQPWQNIGSTVTDREVWRAQLEGRIYVNRERLPTRWRPNRVIVGKPLGSYFAVETFYKQVNARFNGTLARGCDDGQCQFFQAYSARAIRYVAGFHLKFGNQWAMRLSETNHRLLIDLYTGIGARWRWFEQQGVPIYEDARPPDFFGTNRDPTSNWSGQGGSFPSIAFGVQIGYAF